ncbi:MAG: DUF4830 domain-containing protein [Ruminococcus sp.]|nr:DUF4830 domain-containing protein [Ruminococcus sp.]
MFIKTVKIKKPAFALAGVIILIITLAVFTILVISKFGEPEYVLKTEAARQSFLHQLGWQVPKEYEECRIIVIPEDFNDVFENYNKLQKEQGFDLSDYKGKTVEIYTYPVYNYKGYEKKDCIKCNLLICNGKLIGGDVCSVELGGFMQGLQKD